MVTSFKRSSVLRPSVAVGALACALAALVIGMSALFTPPSSAAPLCGGLTQEAEDGELSGIMTSVDDGSASGGAVLGATSGVRNAYVANAANAAAFCLQIPVAGEYRIDAVVDAPDARNDSIFYSVDGSPPVAWHVPTTVGWQARTISSGPSVTTFDLPAGDVEFTILHRETGIRIDYFAVVAADAPAGPPAPPTPVPPVSPPVGGQAPYAVLRAPGVVEAEFYDLGGEGVAFRDLDPTNDGGRVRNDGVDVYPKSGEPGNAVGQTRDGEWLEYTVDFAVRGSYVIDARVASGDANPGSLAVSVDGVHWKTLNVDPTGSWWTWDHVVSPARTISAGQHLIRVVVINGGQFNIDSFEIRPAGAAPSTPTPVPPTPAPPTPVAPGGQSPYVAVTVPGTIEAEFYDLGGAGVAYQDLDDGNVGGQVRSDDVDVYAKAGEPGHAVGRTRSGEWLEYTVTFDGTRDYVIDARVASGSANPGSLAVSVDGVHWKTLGVDSTGSWWTWDNVISPPLTIEGGERLVRVAVIGGGQINIDSFEIREAGAEPTTPTPTPAPPTATPVPQPPACNTSGAQAEVGDLSGTFAVINDGAAEEGRAIRANAAGFVAGSSIAEFCVSLAATSYYTLDARVLAPTASANSMRVQIGSTTNMAWDAPVAAGWTTHEVLRTNDGPNDRPVEPLIVALSRGDHIVRFVAQEPDVAIDSFNFAPTTRPTFTGATGFPDPAPPLRTVRIEPGDPIVDLIASNGTRTEFVFAAGTHVIDNNSGIQPLDGQSFVGEVAADGTLLSVLDGQDTVTRAFRNTAEAKNVTIKQLEIKNFNTGKWDGAVDFDNTVTNTSGDYATRTWVDPSFWVLEDLWVHHNAGDGVEVGSGGRLINVRSTDNRWLGVGGHGRNIEIIGGELARNAIGAREEGTETWHSGGIKITRIKEFTMRGVHVYENYGPGIWMDISVNDALIENNLVEGNTRLGIYYEISFNATIRGNTALGGILVRESTDVVVEDNFVRGSLRIQDEHGSRAGEIFRQPPLMRDGRPYEHYYTTFANNTVCSTGTPPTGITTFGGTYTPSFDTTLWLDNDYFGGTFKQGDVDSIDAPGWRALGHDVDGNFDTYANCPAVPDPR